MMAYDIRFANPTDFCPPAGLLMAYTKKKPILIAESNR